VPAVAAQPAAGPVQGNGDEPVVAHNLLRVLATYDRAGLAPPGWSPTLARGARLPLLGGSPPRGEAYHGEACLGGLPWTADPDWSQRVVAEPAAVAIVQAARRSADDLRLVCIGPLTNLALALRLAPELPELVAGLTIMGGSLRAGGNQSLAAEFNVLADAEAASIVLEAGWRDLALVPVDVCDQARLFRGDVRRLEKLGSPAARLAGELVEFYATRGLLGRGAPLYDPTAWLLTTRPELAEWARVYVGVDTGRGVGHGATLADWRGRSGRAPNVRAAVGLLDRRAFFERFFSLLG
jgi:purine nucleosidase